MIKSFLSALTVKTLPQFFILPVTWLPAPVHSQALAWILNYFFASALAAEKLAFLQDRVLLLRVRDLGLVYQLSAKGKKLNAADSSVYDVSIEGELYDFLLLAARREDPDTLFFNRRLRLGGNTELGLYLKNFLDAFEPDKRLEPLIAFLQRTLDTLECLNRRTENREQKTDF